MEILIAWALTSIVLLVSIIGTESLLIPRLNPSSKFRIWWRRHIIGYYDGPEEI